MTYHKIWRGLNRDEKDKRTRWSDNYVFRKEWYVYPVIFSPILIIATPLLPLYVSLLIVQYFNIHYAQPEWVFDAIFFPPIAIWSILAGIKLLPFILKKYKIIVYAPKGVPL
jgi:hypothetical protein